MKTTIVRSVLIAIATLTFAPCFSTTATAQPPAPSLAEQFAPGSIWIEGEATVKTNVPVNAWLKGDNLKLLSGGDALTGLVKPAALPSPCYALYRFDCPASGDYDLYIRHGFMGNIGAMRYRFVKLGDDGKPAARPGDDEGWLAFDTAAKAWDRQQLGLYRTIKWSRQQRVALEKGTYYLDLQVTGLNPDKVNEPDADVWVVIDAICLTTQPVAVTWAAAELDTPSTTTATGAPAAPATVASAATARAAAAAPAQPATAAAEPAPLFVWIEGEGAQATDVPTTAPQSVWSATPITIVRDSDNTPVAINIGTGPNDIHVGDIILINWSGTGDLTTFNHATVLHDGSGSLLTGGTLVYANHLGTTSGVLRAPFSQEIDANQTHVSRFRIRKWQSLP